MTAEAKAAGGSKGQTVLVGYVRLRVALCIAGGIVLGRAGPDDLSLGPGCPSGTNHEALFRLATAAHGAGLFVTEYAQGHGRRLFDCRREPDATVLRRLDRDLIDALPRQWLGRLRAVMGPEAMDRDVVLVSLPRGGEVSSGHVLARSAEARADVPGGPALLLLLWAGALLRRGRGRRRRWGLVLPALAAAFAAL